MTRQSAYTPPWGSVLSCPKPPQACSNPSSPSYVLPLPHLLDQQRIERFTARSLSQPLPATFQMMGVLKTSMPWMPDHLCAYLPISPEVLYGLRKGQTVQILCKIHTPTLSVRGHHPEARSQAELFSNILLFHMSHPGCCGGGGR